jgi:ATP-dependent DNA helicase DinG
LKDSLDEMTVEGILGPGGLIASRLPSFEVRPQQLTAARAVSEGLAQEKPVMLEAGTGTGKTFAYLVPALIHLHDNPGHRIVISTHTISLQEQLFSKDIPFLLDLFGSSVKAALLKGRSNYISRRRLRHSLRQIEGSPLGFDEIWQDLNRLDSWQRERLDGTRSELGFKKRRQPMLGQEMSKLRAMHVSKGATPIRRGRLIGGQPRPVFVRPKSSHAGWFMYS